MRIKTKLFALLGALSLVTLAVTGVSVTTLGSVNHSVEEVKLASTRALFSERLNRLVTAVVMDARGIYGARDTQDARKFADGVVSSLRDIDTLLARWEPMVAPQERALFDAVKRDAAAFKAFRSETVELCGRLGDDGVLKAAYRGGCRSLPEPLSESDTPWRHLPTSSGFVSPRPSTTP